MDDSLELSFVLPVDKQPETVSRSLKDIIAFFSQTSLPYEILVVGVTPSSATEASVQKMAQEHEVIEWLPAHQISGEGRAVRQGILAAKGRFIVLMEPYLCVPLATVFEFLQELTQDPDTVFLAGSREHTKARLHRAPPERQRRWERRLNRLACYLFGMTMNDAFCGFKIFKKETAHALFSPLASKNAVWPVEIFWQARHQQIPWREHPVQWIHTRKRPPRGLIFFLVNGWRLIQLYWRLPRHGLNG